MADNLKITTPVTMGDHTAQVKGNKNATPIGNIDPTRVFSKESNAQTQDRNTNLQWDSNSVLQSFITKMKATQPLSQTIGKLLTGAMADVTPGAVKTDAQQVLAELAKTSVMDEKQMLENLLFQQKNTSKFTPQLFDLLRVITTQGSNDKLNECIGRFLKAYDGYFGSKQTMNSIAYQLNRVLDSIPKTFRIAIQEAMNGLILKNDGDAAQIADSAAIVGNGNTLGNAADNSAAVAENGNILGNAADSSAAVAENGNTLGGAADSSAAVAENGNILGGAAENSAAAAESGNILGNAADNSAAAAESGNILGNAADNSAAAAESSNILGGAAENSAAIKNNTYPALDDSVIENNLNVLKEKVLPALGKYVSAFNDFGQTRNKISLIIHDISRLNVSTKTELMARFEELIDYMKYEMNLPAKELGVVRQMFDNAMNQNTDTNNKFIDALAKLLLTSRDSGLTTTSQNMVRDVVQSVLLDYNTYMPYNHLFLPVNYNQKQLYTDIWVEKEPEKDKRGRTLPRKIYINFDISDMGSFQAVIGIMNDDVDCRLYIPNKLKKDVPNVNKDVSQIFANVGYDNAKISCIAENVDIKSYIIKRIGERGDSINVTV